MKSELNPFAAVVCVFQLLIGFPLFLVGMWEHNNCVILSTLIAVINGVILFALLNNDI